MSADGCWQCVDHFSRMWSCNRCEDRYDEDWIDCIDYLIDLLFRYKYFGYVFGYVFVRDKSSRLALDLVR